MAIDTSLPVRIQRAVSRFNRKFMEHPNKIYLNEYDREILKMNFPVYDYIFGMMIIEESFLPELGIDERFDLSYVFKADNSLFCDIDPETGQKLFSGNIKFKAFQIEGVEA